MAWTLGFSHENTVNNSPHLLRLGKSLSSDLGARMSNWTHKTHLKDSKISVLILLLPSVSNTVQLTGVSSRKGLPEQKVSGIRNINK